MELEEEIKSLKDLLELKRHGMLTVNPEYQRGAVWSESQQKKLIDSVLRGYPLPLIYLHYKKKTVAGMQREDLEIIDGQQRINALFKFAEGALKLFDPIKDDKVARFPNFIKQVACPWAHCDYLSLSDDLKQKFNETKIFVVKITTDNDDEARDLFIRLQGGLPLNAQEKRDAWPGGYTDFVLKFGGKKEITRYPGHEFFQKHIGSSSSDRGSVRTLCAQIGMLYFEKAHEGNWLEIGTQAIDDYYYTNLGFNIDASQVTKFAKLLDLLVEIFNGYIGPKLKVNEAIHLVMLADSLAEDYTKSWQTNFIKAFEAFKANAANDTKNKNGEYWFNYGVYTQSQATSASSIALRHKFFTEKMFPILNPVLKDPIRGYGQLEREIIYYRDSKKCAVCDIEINWSDLEIHHVDEHQHGGHTTMENGVPVHKNCHPKGQNAIDFYTQWILKQQN
jgi:hypothetical protein